MIRSAIVVDIAQGVRDRFVVAVVDDDELEVAVVVERARDRLLEPVARRTPDRHDDRDVRRAHASSSETVSARNPLRARPSMTSGRAATVDRTIGSLRRDDRGKAVMEAHDRARAHCLEHELCDAIRIGLPPVCGVDRTKYGRRQPGVARDSRDADGRTPR